MNKQTKIGLVVFILIFVTVIVWFLGDAPLPAKKARNPYVSENWDVQFKLNDKDPYGLFLFDQLLRAHVDTNKTIQPITDWIQLDSVLSKKQNITMLFVGNRFGLQNREIDTILNRVKAGSDLFISYNELTENLIQRFFKSYEISYDFADSVTIFVQRNKFPMYYIYQNDTLAHEWKAFSAILPIDSNYQSLSSFMEMSNFIRIKLGKGSILLHTNPEIFFNYQLKRTEGYRYTSFALNHLSKEKAVYLLELGRLLDEENIDDSALDDEEGEAERADNSYLKFILKSPGFIAALGLTFLGLILFMLFRAKRMQPIVPYLPKKKNMSLAFAETITSIYLAKQHPLGILQVQRKNFYDAVNKHFFIDISRREEDREREIRSLVEKSALPESEIRDLLFLFEPTAKSVINDQYIVEVAKKQRAFYLQTGMISFKMLERIENQTFIIQRNLWISYLFVLSGIFVVLLGFYYLVSAIGIGIILWPLGALILALGIRRLTIPLVSFELESVIYHPVFGRKKEFLINELLHISRLNNGIQLQFTENRIITITNFELSRFDRTQLDKFIAKHHQLEVG
jgi:cbb3-type cytochrome oxidase subunit 3